MSSSGGNKNKKRNEKREMRNGGAAHKKAEAPRSINEIMFESEWGAGFPFGSSKHRPPDRE